MLLMNEFGFHISSMGSKVYLIDHLTADELYHRWLILGFGVLDLVLGDQCAD